MSNDNQCAIKDCQKSDCLVGIGSSPTYYCMDHFEAAVREMTAPFKSAMKTAFLEKEQNRND